MMRFYWHNFFNKLLILVLFFINVTTSSAQFANLPMTGYNQDIVANGTLASGAAPSTVATIAVDGTGSGAGFVFVANGFNFAGTSCGATANNLPANGQITSTNTTNATGITYQLQSYSSNNSLYIAAQNGVASLTTATSAGAVHAKKLYFVCLGGNGATTFNVTIHFSDGTSQTTTALSAPDWCSGNAPLLTSQTYYRLGITATSCSGGTCQYLYEVPTAINDTNQLKNITSIDFTKTNAAGTYLHILAVGYQVATGCSGMPDLGNVTTSGTNPVCSGTSFTLGISGTAANYVGITYQWQSSPAGLNTWTNLGSSQTTPSYTISAGITTATDYRLIANCTLTNSIDTSTAISIGINTPTNCYCTATSSSTSYGYISNFTTTNGVQNFAQSSGNSSYTSYITSDTVGAGIGMAVNYSIALNSTSSKYAIFVDWNQNGLFTDPGDTVYSGPSGSTLSSTTQTGSFTVPVSALMGNTRMRVRGTYYSTSYTNAPCGSIYYGETEDYIFKVFPTLSCGFPTNVQVNNVTSTSATFSWSNPTTGSAASYNYELRTSGAAGSGSTGLVSSGSTSNLFQSFTGLTTGTTYYFYISSNCGSSQSYWQSTSVATTAYFPVSLSGFNYDVIASDSGATNQALLSTNNAVDDPTSSGNAGYAFISVNYNNLTAQNISNALPVNRKIIANGKYFILNNYNLNNTLKLGTAIDSSTLTFLTPQKASALHILGVGGSAATTLSYSVIFNDGSSTSFTGFTLNDWYTTTGATVVKLTRRVNRSNGVIDAQGTGPNLYENNITLTGADTTKLITAIKVVKTNTAGFLNIFSISTTPSTTTCTPPSYLVSSSVSANSASVNWSSTGTSYQYSYAPGLTSLAGTGVTGITSNNSLNLSGLTPTTVYNIYVRKICGAGDTSSWYGPLSIQTLSVPCSGVPNAATLSSTSNNICVSTSFTLTAANVSQDSGIVVYWQKKANTTGANWVTLATTTPSFGTSSYSYVISSQSDTSFYRVILKCGISGDSSISNVLTVNQNPIALCSNVYCTPSYPSSCGNNRITGVNFNTINVTGITCGGSAAGDQTATTSTILINGQTYPITVNTAGYLSVAVAIDTNNDGNISTSEVLWSPSYVAVNNNTYSNPSFTIPVLAAGQYRMRVFCIGANAGAGSPVGSPCGTYGYGNYVDYLLKIKDPCPAHVTTITNDTVCAGQSITLLATGDSVTTSFNWYAANNSTGTVLANNNGTFAPTGLTATTTYYVGATNGSCVSDSLAAVTAVVKPLPTVTSHLFAPTTLCLGDSISLKIVTSNGATDSVSWSSIPTAGNGVIYPYNILLTSNDTIKIAPTTANNYVYIATINSVNGCTSKDTFKTDTIHVNGLPNLVINQPSGSCDSFIDITKPAIVLGTTPNNVNYSYYSDAAGTTLLSDPTHIYTSGTYYIKATNPTTGCSKISSVSVLVYPVAHLILDSLNPICYPSNVWLSTAINATSNPSMTYSYYTNNTYSTSIPAPGVVGATGTYYIIGTTYFGCKDTGSVYLSVLTQPTVVINYVSDSLCHPDYVDLTDPAIVAGSTAGLTYTYYNATTSSFVSDPTHVTVTGNYYIIGKNGDNCTDTGEVSVRFYNLASVSGFNFVPTLGEGLGTVTFHPQDAHYVDNYYWEFGDGGTSTESNPTHHYSSNGNYNVTLVVSNNNCPALTDTVLLTINVDTFNNSTSVNDVNGLNKVVNLYPVPASDKVNLKVMTTELSLVSVTVYNNLGSVVYNKDYGTKANLQQIEMDLSSLSSGIYNVKILTNKGLVNKRLEILK